MKVGVELKITKEEAIIFGRGLEICGEWGDRCFVHT